MHPREVSGQTWFNPKMFPTIFLFQWLESLKWWGEGMLISAVVASWKVGLWGWGGAPCPWHTACIFEPSPYLAAGQNFKRKSPLALRERNRSDDSYSCTLGQEIKFLFIVGLPAGPWSNFPLASLTIADGHSGIIPPLLLWKLLVFLWPL